MQHVQRGAEERQESDDLRRTHAQAAMTPCLRGWSIKKAPKSSVRGWVAAAAGRLTCLSVCLTVVG